jgi:hypothetical protein
MEKPKISREALEEVKKTTQNTKGLREMLFFELDRLREGKITVDEARAISRLAECILNSVRLEMEAYKHPLSDEFTRLPDAPQMEVKGKK